MVNVNDDAFLKVTDNEFLKMCISFFANFYQLVPFFIARRGIVLVASDSFLSFSELLLGSFVAGTSYHPCCLLL